MEQIEMKEMFRELMREELEAFRVMLKQDIREETLEHVRSLESENKALKEEIVELEKRVENVEIQQIKDDQYRKKADIIISGVPQVEGESSTNNTVLINTVLQNIMSKIGVQLNPSEIVAAHRLRRVGNMAPAIILRLVAYEKKEAIMRAAKQTRLTAEVLGGSRNIKIFFNHHLSRHYRLLFKEARTLREHGFQYVWSRGDGVILAKMNGENANAKVHTILKASDIEEIKRLHPRRVSNN